MTDTTQILNIRDLRTVALGKEEFNYTIFVEHPEILYRVGNLLLANVVNNRNFLVFHFVLIAMELTLESMHQTFEINQVPMSMSNMTSCLLTKILEILFVKDSIYYEANMSECQEQNDIIICNKKLEDIFSPSIKRFECLNRNLDNCLILSIECHDVIKFTKSGSLIHSQSQIL